MNIETKILNKSLANLIKKKKKKTQKDYTPMTKWDSFQVQKGVIPSSTYTNQ